MFSAQYLCLHREKEGKKKALYPISEGISGGNFASRAAWNVFSAYRAMSPAVREYFVYKPGRGEEPFPATGYQNRSALQSRSQPLHAPSPALSEGPALRAHAHPPRRTAARSGKGQRAPRARLSPAPGEGGLGESGDLPF